MAYCLPPYQNITDDQQAQLALMRLAENLDAMFNGEDRTAPAHTGFMLLVSYPMDGEDRCSVVSNMTPRDMLAMLKLQVARLEGQSFQHGHA